MRPLSSKEAGRSKGVVNVVDRKLVVCLDPGRAKDDVLRAKRSRERRFAFDHAFGPDSEQSEVFENTTAFLLDGVLQGYNATVFAYGATGAGKTYTMLGKEGEARGIMVRTLEKLWDGLQRKRDEERVDFSVTMSYIELYNEQIRDLLTPTSDALDLREDPIRGPVVAGVTEVSATGAEQVMNMLQQGNARRT